jgi:hypothetical protein
VAFEVTNLFEEYYYLTTFDLRAPAPASSRRSPAVRVNGRSR